MATPSTWPRPSRSRRRTPWSCHIDQIWTTAGVNTRNSAQVETEVSFDPDPNNKDKKERETRDTTDHDYAGYTEIF
jgi:hypothetical protein